MTDPSDVDALIPALSENADALGLTWQLRPATVMFNSNGIASVRFDGDAAEINARVVPLVDNVVVGDRVMVMIVPPGSNYIIGKFTAPSVPVALLRQTTLQSIPNGGAFTALNFHTADIDVMGGFDAASPTIYTAQRTGYYSLAGGVGYSANTAGRRWCRWRVSGVDVPVSGANMNAISSGQSLLVARTVNVELAAGDTVELLTFQDSGGASDTYVGVAYAQSSMAIAWLGAVQT